MPFAPIFASASYGAGRQPFASIQNLPTTPTIPAGGFRKIVSSFPSFASQAEAMRRPVCVKTLFHKNTDSTRQPHCPLEPSVTREDLSSLDMSMASIYSQDNAESSIHYRRNSIVDDLAHGAMSPVAQKDQQPETVLDQVQSGSRSRLKRVRTVNKTAGLAMKERRRKGELDLPTLPVESLHRLAVLLKKRREAAERFHKF